MKKWIFLGLFLISSLCVRAQLWSNINYPVAECIGGTCPSPTTVKSHITSVFADSLTETLYVGGPFRTLGGQTRIGIGAINGATGALLSFAPVIDTFGCIYAMGIKGDTLFIGGHFTKVNGVTRNNFAAIRISTGALLSSFNSGIGGVGDTVFSINVYQGRIYVGGKFSVVFGQSRSNMARLNYNGTVNSWNPSVGGIVRKTLQSTNRIVAIADSGIFNSKMIRIDTFSAGVTQLMITTGSTIYTGEHFHDFVIRNDTVYAVGAFYQLDNVYYQNFVACRISNGGKRSTYVTLPVSDPTFPGNRFTIAYYYDSLFVGTFDGLDNDNTYHKLYRFFYSRAALTVVKTYNSAIPFTGDGKFNGPLCVSNARLYEVERYAVHANNPYGSFNCDIFSYCLRIPNQCGGWLQAPVPACPNDTIWAAVVHNNMYATYLWTASNGTVLLFPDVDSCMIVTTAAFAGGTIYVRGITSCGSMNTATRNGFMAGLALPNVSAGPDDSLSCIITQTTLHGTASSLAQPISWSWSGPSGFSVADSINISAPGMYYATVTDANGCKKTDSAFVFADTIPPTIVPYGSSTTLTCVVDSVLLDAASLYPSDSLRWFIGAGSYPNHAYATVPGDVYLVVTDRNNGCDATDTIVIGQNTVLPNASIVYSSTMLTCVIDSVLLAGNTSTTGVVFYWLNSTSDTFADPLWVDTVGFYSLLATNMINGCSTQIVSPYINGWYTPPNITLLTDSFNINCSYDSVLLSASSLTLSATLQWIDSVSFNSPNPALTGLQGWYYLIATDTLNGCVTIDSAFVGFDSTLTLVGVNDTAICPGSGAVLNVSPVGGTPTFSYQWNNSGGNTALVTVYPTDTLEYIVTVTDANGCVGEDTVIVGVPDPMLDSTLSFQPCDPLQPTGQIQVYPWGGVPPYQFSIDNGLSWQSNGVFGGLTYGSYQFLIQDALGCTRNTSGIIDTNSLSPAPEFLVSTSPESGDTIVIVDISNPRPDSVVWDFPAGTIIVDTSMFSPAIIPGDTGAFSISMHAYYGTCEVVLTRLINIQPFDSLNANPWQNNAIDSLILYPNPNNGVFTVHTELEGKQDFVIIVTDELGNERGRQQVFDADVFTGQMSVSNPVPGNYILRVIAEFDSAEIIFVISQ